MKIEKFIAHIVTTIHNFFVGLTPILKKASVVAYNITNAFKNFDTNNPAILDGLTALVPGHWDDQKKEELRAKLPEFVVKLRLVSMDVQNKTPAEILQEAIKFIQSLPKKDIIRGNALDGFAVLVQDCLADGKIDWNDAKYLMKYVHDNKQTKTFLDLESEL